MTDKKKEKGPEVIVDIGIKRPITCDGIDQRIAQIKIAPEYDKEGFLVGIVGDHKISLDAGLFPKDLSLIANPTYQDPATGETKVIGHDRVTGEIVLRVKVERIKADK